VKHGLLIIGNFNKTKYDRTNWYTLSDLAIEYYPRLSKILQRKADNPSPASCGDFAAGSGETPTPIPNPSTTSSNNTITTSVSSSKSKFNELMREMIDAYREVFPDNPQPHPRVIATSLQKTLCTLIKRWPELDPERKPLTKQRFRKYLELLHDNAPKFSRGEYVTANGNRKKNNLETFARWNTIVKFLENQYS
jgi:hypothetical protein